MTHPEHQSVALVEEFVRLADTRADSYDVDGASARLAGACVDLVPADAAGVVLAVEPDQLRVSAQVPNARAFADLFGSHGINEVARRAYVTGEPVDLPDLAEATSFPAFAATASRSGFRAAHVLPMRLRTETVGALILLFTTPAPAEEHSRLYRARGLVAMATAGIIAARATRVAVVRTEQLRSAASDRRVVVEQAKGMIAAHDNSGDVESAYAVIRAFARRHNIRVYDVAEAIAARTVSREPGSEPQAAVGAGLGHVSPSLVLAAIALGSSGGPEPRVFPVGLPAGDAPGRTRASGIGVGGR